VVDTRSDPLPARLSRIVGEAGEMARGRIGGPYGIAGNTVRRRREAAIEEFAAEQGITPVRAGELARQWEFEANRRGLDANDPSYWSEGRSWMSAHHSGEISEP
jgi:hypothetical protein